MTQQNRENAAARQRGHTKSGDSQAVLGRLTDHESAMVLHTLLKRHDALLGEAEKLATEIMNTPSCEDIASAVVDTVTSLDI